MRFLIFCIIILLPDTLFAQTFPMLHYSIENGLPSNTIYDIYQDPNGFIWIATDKGTAKYNGQKFGTFTTADGLSDNECFFFKPDHSGRLWIGTSNGELCYYKNGVFHNATNTPFLKLPLKASVTKEINLNKDSSITFFLSDALGFYEINGEKVTRVLNSIMEAKSDGNYYLHVNKIKDGVFEVFYLDEKVTFDQNKNSYKSEPYQHFKIQNFIFNQQNGFFVTETNQIYSEDLKPVNFKNPEWFKHCYIYKIYDDNGCKILATNKGAIFDGLIILLPNYEVHSILKDNNGDYWLATAKNGIYKINRGFLHERQIKIKTTEAQSVIFAHKVKNYILYATKDRTVYRLDLINKQTKILFDYSKFSNKSNQFKSAHWTDGYNYYNFSRAKNFKISNVLSASNSNIQQLNMGDLQGPYRVFVSHNYRFLEASHNLYYFAKNAFNGRSGSIVTHEVKYDKLGAKMYGAALDQNGELWFSTIDSVYMITDTIAKAQRQFGFAAFREFVFFNGCFIGITHQNQLLLSNNYLNEKITFDTVKSNDCVWGKFYGINDTTLFISTNNYFRILNVKPNLGKLKFSLRLLENPSIPYQPDYLLVDSLQCYFFKDAILTSYPLQYLLQKEPLPSLKISTLKTSKSSYNISDTMVLNYDEAQNIRVLFSSVAFNNTDLSYEYSIVTNEKKETWYPIRGEELNLVKLGFGNFIIKVRAKTMSDEYSLPGIFLLSVKRPYWASVWFIATCVVIVIAAAIYLARIWSKRKLKKKENELRFLKSEYKSLNALMNPHFIFNSLNSVQGLVNNREISAASKYIRIFSDLIRQNMHNISNELISLDEEMNLVENYIKIEQLRLNDGLHYSIEIADGIEGDLIMVPPLLIQPLVENAIKHGIWLNESNDGFIAIRIYEKGAVLFIEIKDNGVGLGKGDDSDTTHKSYAMNNINRRIEQLSQIHKTKITIEMREMTDTGGNVLGVMTLVTIQMNNK